MNFRRLRSGLGLVAFLVAASAGAGLAQVAPAPNATFAPATSVGPTVPPGAAPSPSPSARPKRGHKAEPTGTPSPEPTDTPEPPQFETLDGIWEVEVQPLGRRLALYEHFFLIQNGKQLSGYWEHKPGRTRTPVTGTFDGRLFQLTAQTATVPVTFSGYVENMADMVGMKHVGPADPGVAFTGQHRKKTSPDDVKPKGSPSPGGGAH